ncbi:MAG: hypothetical protein V3S89_05715 [Desulfobacterales bacterium]
MTILSRLYSYVLLALLSLLPLGVPRAFAAHVLRTQAVEVIFDAPLDAPARDLAKRFPEIRQSLETIFQWTFHQIPTITLVKDREDFLKMTRNPLTVAFASHERNRIVIDHSRMIVAPFTLETTLRHELCHILLHQHIDRDRLPRWLDEGLCQWVSDSIGEMLQSQKQSALNEAILARGQMSLKQIRYRFPEDRRGRLLAYDAGKSATAHMIRRYGKPRVIDLLHLMERGEPLEGAMVQILAISLDSFETQWHNTLKRKTTWFTFFSHYLYEILFSLMALLTIYGFIRSRIRKRNYRDEDEDDPINEEGSV